ncbi:phospholipase D-like domain-containing protein [Maridesulfovibrio hydrothermalis]|uniref:Phospholipase D/Transphosphatidylase n=1 Tax=Maridesulfovibrio hydrothermalis AM13 = DSM 14728 TaxID=1121451 RepID=L0RBS0_9BACT|nr:phospholipase D-like domain-containing protein [Maridesulfovibrio hydrothermalis]CCO22991.1 Phospholipase D/Transphosphatidylase [Maridesulfovibrio hydrothermalis AM13 = DSM 14728]
MEWNLLIGHLAIVGGFCLAAILVMSILRKQRTSSAAFAWLLAIFFVPYIGVPLYLTFGGRKLKRDAHTKENIHLEVQETVPIEKADPIDVLLREYGIPGATGGNKVKLCPTGIDIYNELVKLIENAEHQILITTYILSRDVVGKDIVDRLARKAASGVTIRLLLDDIGSMFTTRRYLAPLLKNGGKVAYFMPLFRAPFHGNSNLRNHRKIAIADQKVVLAGGTNIANEYMGPTPCADRWTDLSFVLRGPAVRHYLEVFQSDWLFAYGEKVNIIPPCTEGSAISGEGVMQVVPSGPDVPRDPVHDALLTAAYTAEKRLWFVTPYYVPDEALAQALRLAALRGVDLRVVVPARSNHKLADLARGTHLRELERCGGKIIKYPHMVHAKVVVVDDRLAVVGSANMDMRSLFLNYEIVMFSYSKADIAPVHDWVQGLIDESDEGVQQVGMVRDTVEGLARLIAPLL